jgi:hypothetical protein
MHARADASPARASANNMGAEAMALLSPGLARLAALESLDL